MTELLPSPGVLALLRPAEAEPEEATDLMAGRAPYSPEQSTILSTWTRLQVPLNMGHDHIKTGTTVAIFQGTNWSTPGS